MDEDALINGDLSGPTGPDAPGVRPALVQIADHHLLRQIGQGSYGEVWLARNMMGVHRAVKVVYRNSFADQRPFERELSGIRRFEPISRSYEGFMDVLHVGINEEQGYFYYVMELGDDVTSGQAIDPDRYAPKTLAKELSSRGKLPLAECLQLGLALTQALAELHRHGLVHRDIKPSNIIFVNGVPKLADIGLVAEAGEARSYVGTEGFIPPEGPGTPQADVYSLGKVLYECCTGKDRQEFPELPTLLDEFSEREGFLEFNEVILSACDNDPGKRYGSAWDMHADLLVLANGKSVKRLKVLEQRLSDLKRIAGISALVLVTLGFLSYHFYREWRTRTEAQQRQVGASVAHGNQAVEAGDLLGSLPYFVDALRFDRKRPGQERIHRMRLGSALAGCAKLTHVWMADRQVDFGEFSPDGATVLIAERYGALRIYDIETGQSTHHPFSYDARLRTATFSPDGRYVLTATEFEAATVWTAAGFTEVMRLEHPDKVFCAKFSPDGTRIVTACKDGLVRVWRIPGREPELVITGHADGVLSVAFSPDGARIVSTSNDNTARLWDANSGMPVAPPLVHGSWVTGAHFSPDSQKVVTASLDRKARVWEADTGKRVPPDLNHGDGVKSAEFSPDGRLLVTASLDGTARLWLTDSLEPLEFNPVLKHSERLTRASFNPHGNRILTTGTDGTVCIWDLAGSTPTPAPVAHALSRSTSRYLVITNQNVRVWDAARGESLGLPIKTGVSPDTLELSSNGRFLAGCSGILTNSGTATRTVRVWDVLNGKPWASLTVPAALNKFAMSDDGKRLFLFGGGAAELWHLPDNRSIPLSAPPAAPIGSAVFSPEADLVAVSSEHEIRVWNTETGQPAFLPLKHIRPVRNLEFSPDGARLVSSCLDVQFTRCYAQVWDARTGEAVGPRLMHGDGVLFASFSPDGTRVVTAGEDFQAMVWEIPGGRQLTPPLRHREQVRMATFSANGRLILTASADETARVWDAFSGEPVTPPLRHWKTVIGARFLDAQRIVTRDERDAIRIWTLPVEDKPVEDLLPLARLLAGTWTSPQSAGAMDESLVAAWQRLRNKHPIVFETTSEQVLAWHEAQADACAVRNQNASAAFHRKQIQAAQAVIEKKAGISGQ